MKKRSSPLTYPEAAMRMKQLHFLCLGIWGRVETVLPLTVSSFHRQRMVSVPIITHDATGELQKHRYTYSYFNVIMTKTCLIKCCLWFQLRYIWNLHFYKLYILRKSWKIMTWYEPQKRTGAGPRTTTLRTAALCDPRGRALHMSSGYFARTVPV